MNLIIKISQLFSSGGSITLSCDQASGKYMTFKWTGGKKTQLIHLCEVYVYSRGKYVPGALINYCTNNFECHSYERVFFRFIST